MKPIDDFYKIIAPLSLTVTGVVIIEGKDFKEEDFDTLTEYIRTLRTTIFGTPKKIRQVQPKAAVEPKKKKRKFNKIECTKHPGTPRSSTTNRCIACQKELGSELVQRRWKKVKDNETINIPTT